MKYKLTTTYSDNQLDFTPGMTIDEVIRLAKKQLLAGNRVEIEPYYNNQESVKR